MKVLALATLLVTLSTHPMALAEKSDFASHQGHALEEIDQRIQKLQELKACVQSASDRAAVQKCRASMKEFRSEQRAEREERRQERRSRREK